MPRRGLIVTAAKARVLGAVERGEVLRMNLYGGNAAYWQKPGEVRSDVLEGLIAKGWVRVGPVAGSGRNGDYAPAVLTEDGTAALSEWRSSGSGGAG